MKEKIENLILEMMYQQNVPGFAIGIVKDDQVIFEKGFGTINLDTKKPVTTESVFQLCSIAKGFVATAIMQLVEVDKIDLDSPVTIYLPYFQINDERINQITVRHMLTHTSGLPGFDFKERFQALREIPPVYDDQAAERYVRKLTSVSLLSDPGQEFIYSDMAYNILGDVIAKTAGQSFESYIQDYIFIPLGMHNSTFMVQDVNQDLLVVPHVKGETDKVTISNIFPYSRHDAPSSNLYSNVVDMARWAKANLNKGVLDEVRILSESAHDVLWSPYVETEQDTSFYGFGWKLGTENEHQIVHHTGGDLGFQAKLLLAPEDLLSVVTMGNYLDENVDAWYASDIAFAAMNVALDEAKQH